MDYSIECENKQLQERNLMVLRASSSSTSDHHTNRQANYIIEVIVNSPPTKFIIPYLNPLTLAIAHGVTKLDLERGPVAQPGRKSQTKYLKRRALNPMARGSIPPRPATLNQLVFAVCS